MKEKRLYSDLFERLSAYSDLTLEGWDQMVPFIVRRELAPGEYFDKADRISFEFCYIEKGLFRSFYRNGNGDEFIKNFSSEGQFLGSFTSLLTAAPSEMSIQALEPSVILVMDFKTFREFCARHSVLEKGARLIAEYAFMESEAKEKSLLIYNAAERYEIFLKTHAHIIKRIHQYMIAMYLGISPVSLSRIINNNPKKV